VVLREMVKDPARKIIVIDPRKSETAAMADIHLAIRPATDAWCLAGLVAILLEENLIKRDWLNQHSSGLEAIIPAFSSLSIAHCAASCGIEEEKLRETARVIAAAQSVAVLEDLGLQMNRHSTLGSYLQRLVWVLTGNYGHTGTHNPFVPFLSLSKASKGETGSKKPAKRVEKRSPVVGAKIIIGLIPCNIIPEEILTDHPKRYRALLVQSGNPLHSLADSQKMREAMRALELSVVVDVAMTETAREAHYVLPASSQFEKAEATFFNLEYPKNVFHLRQPLFAPLAGTLPEAEIYARLVEALGVVSEKDYAPLRRALKLGRTAFALRFFLMMARKPKLMAYAPVLLYRTLGETLPKGMESAAALWGIAQLHLQGNKKTAAAAGFGGLSLFAGEKLFQALLDNPSGVVFSESNQSEAWAAITHPNQRINLYLPELLPELAKLAEAPPPQDAAFPFTLSAGERRSETSNTAVRDPAWHKRGTLGALRIHPQDAAALGCAEGGLLKLSTKRASVEVRAELTDTLQPGHISLPNGLGLDYPDAEGRLQRRGVAPNDLTDVADRDFLTGTPWHKCVPARLERVEA
jgi:anaerobic selenocysteine-containing dehydrogenase